MVFGTYRDLFTAVAASAASLTGLLFVAISVAPRSSRADRRDVVRQVRAAASLLAFTNVLSVSLFGLVPGNNVGYPSDRAGHHRRAVHAGSGCGPCWPTRRAAAGSGASSA